MGIIRPCLRETKTGQGRTKGSVLIADAGALFVAVGKNRVNTLLSLNIIDVNDIKVNIPADQIESEVEFFEAGMRDSIIIAADG